MKEVRITDIRGVKVGHDQSRDGGSVCTVLLFDHAYLASCDVRGGAPATRETDLLKPSCGNQGINAVLLSGGSAFGLEATVGVMQYLEEKGIGYPIAGGVVPIVCGASIFDLSIGDWNCRPDKVLGYQACLNAKTGDIEEGVIGAGTGASVGKLFGHKNCMKSGIGTYALQYGNVIVGAIVAVNAVGDIYDIDTNRIIAGAYKTKPGDWYGQEAIFERLAAVPPESGGNTTIGCVLTNARLDKGMMQKMAEIAHNGYARAIRPVHTLGDGDTIFSVTAGEYEADINTVQALGAEVMARAILRAASLSHGAYGHPGALDQE